MDSIPKSRFIGFVALVALTGLIFAHPSAAAAPTDETPRPSAAYLADALVGENSFKVRLQIILWLGESGEPDVALPVLLAHVRDDPHHAVRAAAAVAAAALGDARAVPQLLSAAAIDSDRFVREQAAESVEILRRHSGRDAVPFAVAAFGSEDEDVRRAALQFLSGDLLTDVSAAAAQVVLLRALGDTPTVYAAATAVLHKLDDEATRTLLGRALAHRDAAVRRGAVQYLGVRATQQSAELALRVFERDAETEEVRAATRATLRKLRDYMPISQLIADARGADKDRRARSLKLLGVIGGDGARQLARDALMHDEDIYVRGTAVVTLSDLADLDAVPLLERAAQDPINQRIAHLVHHAINQLRYQYEHEYNSGSGAQ